ncbi:MAG: glycosyltransferase, partial [Oscillospiraceae bacterium]|nr:glycosyltransferase [Oscillospiraceae bacterium]
REKTIVSVGRLHPVKGFDRLIRIFSTVSDKYPDWKLKIIGDGEEYSNLLNVISEYGLEDKVILTGKMDSMSLEQEMKKASVFTMTSHSEGLSFVLLEALSCGLPMVVFDVRVGNKMVVKDGENGFLVPDSDEEAFADKLEQLMQSSEMCSQYGEQARTCAEFFSRENVAKIWFDVLENNV